MIGIPKRRLLITTLVLVALFSVGAMTLYAQGPGGTDCNGNGHGRGMHGQGMMGGNFSEDCPQNEGEFGMGMMQGHMGPMMMGRMMQGQTMQGEMMQSHMGPMMMGQMMQGPMGRMMSGQFGPDGGEMGLWQPSADLVPANGVQTIDEATAIATAYIAQWDSEQVLALGEVMQFDNHFYATAVESETERAAFEFLIDPITGAVMSEPGPNMMWNLRYGMHVQMGFTSVDGDGVEMSVSLEDARTNAQAELDNVWPTATIDPEEADIFYGYYTFHILEDDAIVGMLSVNGYTGDVWLHRWHGEFLEMRAE